MQSTSFAIWIDRPRTTDVEQPPVTEISCVVWLSSTSSSGVMQAGLNPIASKIVCNPKRAVGDDVTDETLAWLIEVPSPSSPLAFSKSRTCFGTYIRTPWSTTLNFIGTLVRF